MEIDEQPKKRKPSKWQLFLKSCIPQEPKDRGMGEKVTACGVKYRELKEKNPQKLEEMIESVNKTKK